MKDYLQSSFKKSMKERKEYYLYDIPVYILNPLPDHISMSEILDDLRDLIPHEYFSGLEGIYVGEFPEMKERDIHAMFKEGAIYVSSFKDHPEIDEDLIVGNIVHELAHMLEDKYHYELYGDDAIENEYVGKKKRLIDLLRANGVSFHGMGNLFFSDDMVDELDEFLFKHLGYDSLSSITPGLFLSPYSVTSLREYFANGFEEYINGDSNYLKEISPVLFNKLESFLEI